MRRQREREREMGKEGKGKGIVRAVTERPFFWCFDLNIYIYIYFN